MNVLVYAFRRDGAEYPMYRHWLESAVNSDSAFGLADLVLRGFLRVVTHPRVFSYPKPIRTALAWITTVQGFSCFPGQRWRHPFA